MSFPYNRHTETRRWVAALSFLSMLVGLGVIIVAWLIGLQEGPALLPYIIVGVLFILLGAMFSRVASIWLKIEDNGHRIHDLLIETREQQDKQAEIFKTLRDNSQISDAAKSITHRELERDALRRAIREDIVKEDWEAAYNLIDEMERRFGYRLEAYNYRKEVDEFRAKVIEEKVQASMRHVRRLSREHRWVEAAAEAQRLIKLAPNDERAAEVLAELNAAREEFKEQLLSKWRDAVESKNLDEAIDLLKVLDPFLTRDEAAKLEDTARSVFKARLLDHAAQFREAVTEKRWEDAIKIGRQIRDEFPNSLMAKEVSESMDALQQKASKAAAGTT